MNTNFWGNISDVVTAAGTILGLGVTVWIAIFVHRWTQSIDKLQHIRLMDELWQTVNLAVIENPSLQKIAHSIGFSGRQRSLFCQEQRDLWLSMHTVSSTTQLPIK